MSLRAVRHVAVGPGGVLARRAPRGSNRLGCASSTKGRSGVLAAADGRPRRPRSRPGCRPGGRSRPGRPRAPPRGSAHQGPVELEHAGPVAVARQAPPVGLGSALPAMRQQLARRHIQQRRRGGGSSASESIAPPGLDPPAERAEVGGQRIGDPCAPPRGHRPADRVRAERQHQAEGRAGRCFSEQDRVGGDPANRARAARPEACPGQARPSGGRRRRSGQAASGWRGGCSGPRKSADEQSA